MELMASSGVHRGLTRSCPMPSMLSIGRRLGTASPKGVFRDEGSPTATGPQQQQPGAQRLSAQNPSISFDTRPVNASQRSGKSAWARVRSQQSKPSESVDGVRRESALSYMDGAHNKRRPNEAVVALPQALQSASASPPRTSLAVENPFAALEVIPAELLQGTQEWLDLRKNRVTASSFGNALGFWGGARRGELWEEKIGVREPFAGNAATLWGSSEEASAIEKYKAMTGNSVSHTAFKIYGDGDDHLSWLGASPDGLITYSNAAEEEVESGERLGVLEVKCPYNKGRPELGSPWEAVPHYYMPQAQGLLEIFDREHMDFYVWTMKGSSVFRIERNAEYWGLMFRMMAEFWWGSVIPAKGALEKGKTVADVQAFRPVEDVVATERIVRMSRHLAQSSRLIWRERTGRVQQF